jgi:phage terminase large subunit-like protein
VNPQVESGKVYLPHRTIVPWAEARMEECDTFANGSYNV